MVFLFLYKFWCNYIINKSSDNAKEKREKLVRKIYQLENIKSNEIEEEKKIYSDDEEEKIKSSSQLDPSNVSNNPIDDISDKVILIKKFLEIKKNWKGKKKNSKVRQFKFFFINLIGIVYIFVYIIF